MHCCLLIGFRTHKFIFLKPLRVGGTSVQQTIGNACEDGDVVSAFSSSRKTYHGLPTAASL